MSDPEKDNLFDPFGILRGLRETVGGEAYAKATATMIDAYLSASGFLRSQLQNGLEQLNLPTKDDLAEISRRLSAIEQRLDDMEAGLQAPRPAKKKAPKTDTRRRKSAPRR